MRKVAVLVVFLAGCQGVPMLPGMRPHQIDIQQGNYVTQDMVAKLKPGMSRSQVRFALGTPLITDPFHPNRWDYIYVLQKQGKVQEHRRIVVVFEGDTLARIEGDVTPAKTGAAGASGTSTAAKPAASAGGSSAAAPAPGAASK